MSGLNVSVFWNAEASSYTILEEKKVGIKLRVPNAVLFKLIFLVNIKEKKIVWPYGHKKLILMFFLFFKNNVLTYLTNTQIFREKKIMVTK